MSKLYIQPRDKILFELLNKYNLLTTNQIQNLVFSNINKATVLRRLRHLEKHSYICQSAILDNYSRTWQLSDRSALVIDDARVFKVCNRNTIQHDILISTLRLRLESLGLGKEWISGFEIKSAQGQNKSFKLYSHGNSHHQISPDGLMIESIKSKNYVISLELELTLKSKSRYRALIGGYALNNKIDFVMYVFKDKSSLRLFQKIMKEIGYYYEKLWLVLIDDILNLNDFKVYLFRENKWISLSEMGFDLYEKPAQGAYQGVSKFNEDEALSINEDNSIKLQLKNEIEF